MMWVRVRDPIDLDRYKVRNFIQSSYGITLLDGEINSKKKKFENPLFLYLSQPILSFFTDLLKNYYIKDGCIIFDFIDPYSPGSRNKDRSIGLSKFLKHLMWDAIVCLSKNENRDPKRVGGCLEYSSDPTANLRILHFLTSFHDGKLILSSQLLEKEGTIYSDDLQIIQNHFENAKSLIEERLTLIAKYYISIIEGIRQDDNPIKEIMEIYRLSILMIIWGKSDTNSPSQTKFQREIDQILNDFYPSLYAKYKTQFNKTNYPLNANFSKISLAVNSKLFNLFELKFINSHIRTKMEKEFDYFFHD